MIHVTRDELRFSFEGMPHELEFIEKLLTQEKVSGVPAVGNVFVHAEKEDQEKVTKVVELDNVDVTFCDPLDPDTDYEQV